MSAAARLALLCPLGLVTGAVLLPAPLVVSAHYGVSGGSAVLSMALLAVAGCLGAAALGRLTDTLGRRWVIVATYVASGLTLGTAAVVHQDTLSAPTIVVCWSLVVFLAAAGSGAALAAVLETTPVAGRGVTGGAVLALGTALASVVGAAAAHAVATGPRAWAATGWYVTAAVLALGALVAWRFPVETARRPLEDLVPEPLHSEDSTPTPDTPAAGAEHVGVTPHPHPTVGRRHLARFGQASRGSAAGLADNDPRRVADVARILQALGESSLTRGELEARAAARHWPPGRFRAALRAALERGHVVQVEAGRFAKAPSRTPDPRRPG